MKHAEGTGDSSHMTQFRKFGESFGLGKNASDDTDRSGGTSPVYVKADGINMSERFEREALLHRFDFLLKGAT
jgi:hypothetical protein